MVGTVTMNKFSDIRQEGERLPQPCYVIAELGSNHNGDMNIAMSLIDAAKDAGAHCVKFQSWSASTIFSRKKYEDNYFLADDYRDNKQTNLEEIVNKYAITEDQLKSMAAYAASKGIECTSTPFSEPEADFLAKELDVPFIKVASMDLTNIPFLKHLAGLGKPLVLSTGMGELYEIDRAVRTVEEMGNTSISILHCVSTYPPMDEEVSLKNIATLKTLYPQYSIGFSDHTLGVTIPLAACALEIDILEKHFTLDKEMEGWDHRVSANSEEMTQIVEGSKRIAAALGGARVEVPETAERISEFRRSVVLVRAMKQGEELSQEDITFKRPGSGIPPELVEFLVGFRINKDLPADHILDLEDIN